MRSAACPSVLTLIFGNCPGFRFDAGRAAHSRWAICPFNRADGRRCLLNARFGVFGTLTTAMTLLAQHEVGSIGSHHIQRQQIFERFSRLLARRALVVRPDEELRDARWNRRVLEHPSAGLLRTRYDGALRNPWRNQDRR